MKVGGRWKYLFRAVDKHGRLIDFMLSDRRNIGAAHRFLGKALKIMRHWPPSSITTDQLGSYPRASCMSTICLCASGAAVALGTVPKEVWYTEPREPVWELFALRKMLSRFWLDGS